jgi:hypothetical protein
MPSVRGGVCEPILLAHAAFRAEHKVINGVFPAEGLVRRMC